MNYIQVKKWCIPGVGILDLNSKLLHLLPLLIKQLFVFRIL